MTDGLQWDEETPASQGLKWDDEPTPQTAAPVDATERQPYSGFLAPDAGTPEYAAMTGAINPVSYAMQKTAQAGNTIGSGVLNAVTALPKAAWSLATLGDRTYGVPNALDAPIDAAKNYASGAINKGVDYLKNTDTGKYIAGVASEHPEFSEDVKSIPGMLGTVAPVNGITKMVGLNAPAAAAAKEKAPGFFSNVMNSPEEHAEKFWQNRATPDQAKHVAGLKYADADRLGGALSPNKRNQFIDEAYGADKGPDGDIVPPSPIAQKILENLDKTRDQPLTLRGAQNIEQDINKNISYQPNGMLTPESVQLLKIKRALRNTINSARPEDMVGGTGGWASWNDAKKAYSATGILTDISNMINKSTYAAQPGDALKRNLARWSNKTSATSGLDLDEMDLVKDAIKTDFAHEMLRTGSSRLVPIASAALGLGTGHGLFGAAAGTALGMGGRSLAFSRQLAKMGELADAIGERLPDMTKAPPPSPSKALVPVGPVVNHMTDEQIAHARARMLATGNRSTPLAGGAVLPPTYQASPEQFGFSRGAIGDPVAYPPPEPPPPFPDPFTEPPDLTKSFFNHKATGGRVKGKMGFKLKSKDK